MKILVDSTIAFKEKTYELIPVIVLYDGKEVEDSNSDELYFEVLHSDNISKYTTSFYPVTKIEESIDANEETLILTIPRKLSGQYQVYKTLESKFPKLKVIEGTCFYSNYDEATKILSSESSFDEKISLINGLNERIFFQGMISNFSHMNKKGRISTTTNIVVSLFRLKAHLIFENGEWKKYNMSRNTIKLLKSIVSKIKNFKNITIYCANEKIDIVTQLIGIIKNTTPSSNIKIKRFTVAMLIHSGPDFVVVG